MSYEFSKISLRMYLQNDAWKGHVKKTVTCALVMLLSHAKKPKKTQVFCEVTDAVYGHTRDECLLVERYCCANSDTHDRNRNKQINIIIIRLTTTRKRFMELQIETCHLVVLVIK